MGSRRQADRRSLAAAATARGHGRRGAVLRLRRRSRVHRGPSSTRHALAPSCTPRCPPDCAGGVSEQPNPARSACRKWPASRTSRSSAWSSAARPRRQAPRRACPPAPWPPEASAAATFRLAERMTRRAEAIVAAPTRRRARRRAGAARPAAASGVKVDSARCAKASTTEPKIRSGPALANGRRDSRKADRRGQKVPASLIGQRHQAPVTVKLPERAFYQPDHAAIQGGAWDCGCASRTADLQIGRTRVRAATQSSLRSRVSAAGAPGRKDGYHSTPARSGRTWRSAE